MPGCKSRKRKSEQSFVVFLGLENGGIFRENKAARIHRAKTGEERATRGRSLKRVEILLSVPWCPDRTRL